MRTPVDPIELLDFGIRAERLGVSDRALTALSRAAEESADPDVISDALSHRAHVLRRQGRWAEALAAARSAQEVAGSAGLVARRAEALNAEASIALTHGDPDTAIPILTGLVAITGDTAQRGMALQNLGLAHAQRGSLGEAEEAFEASLDCFTECGYARGEAIGLSNLGRIALDRNDLVRAASIFTRSAAIARRMDDLEMAAVATSNLGETKLAQGDHGRAIELLCEALGHCRASDNTTHEVECLRILGDIEVARGDAATAEAYYERGLGLAQSIDARTELGVIAARLATLRNETAG